MVGASPPEDARAEVREIIDSGLAKLREWLDMRLQQQEDDILQYFGIDRDVPKRKVSLKGTSVKRHSTERVVTLSSEIEVNEFTEMDHLCAVTSQESTEEDLRIAGSTVIEPFLPGSTALDLPLPSDDPEVMSILSGASREQGKEMETIQEQSLENHQQLERQTSMDSVQETDWQSKLMDVFDQLDLDNSGSIDRTELAEAFKEMDMQEVEALGVFSFMDKTGNGLIDRIEWLHLLEEAARCSDEDANPNENMRVFFDRLAKRQNEKGRVYETNRHRRPFLILRHDSPWRMAWDVMLMLLLLYISVSLPYSLGFGVSGVIETIDRVCDIIFCCDVVLNFRTTYMDRDENVIVDSKQIACKYLKSWFGLDFISSLPIDLITAGLLPNLTPARLLKIGKIAKIMKLLRLSKMLTVLQESELMEKLEERSTSRAHQTAVRILKLVMMAFLVAHWLACFGTAVDRSSLDVYFANQVVEPSSFQLYVAAIYWAMTTLSTVGYGDIVPQSDQERGYAMIAMVIGGSLYGYVIGSVTSIVTDIDLNKRAFHERMELIQSWLDRHDEIPKLLRRRLRKHFKRALAAKLAMDDSSVVNELSPELRADTAFFLIHERVRQHPMFFNIPNSALAKLVEVLQKSHANADEFIVKMGDPGIAMYILVDGAARYDQGQSWHPPGTDAPSKRFKHVVGGDSFGEEIIFGLAETYTYTIVTITECEIHSISEDGFQERYQNMPELRGQMYDSFINSLGCRTGQRGVPRASVLDAKRKESSGLMACYGKPQSSGLRQNPYRKHTPRRLQNKPGGRR